MTDRLKAIVDEYIGPTEKEMALIFVIRRALKECTSGQYVSRAERTKMVLEDCLSKYEVSDD